MKIQNIFLILLVFFSIISNSYSTNLTNSQLEELKFNYSSQLEEINYNYNSQLQEKEHNENREYIAYSFFLVYLMIISSLFFYIWFRSEDLTTMRKTVMKWASLGVSIYHIFFFLRVLFGFITQQSFYIQSLIYSGLTTTFIIIILALIVWEVKDKILDDPFYFFHQLFTAWRNEKQQNKYKRFNK